MNPATLRARMQQLEQQFAVKQMQWEHDRGPQGNQPPFKPGRGPVAPAAPERETTPVVLSDGRLGRAITYTNDDRFLVQLDVGQTPWVGDPDSANTEQLVVSSRWLTADLIELR